MTPLNDARDWRQEVVYQIYPRSFCDSNGDGIGDLPGIVSRLDYLERLGVGVVWLSPIYASPNDDNGYDISDYRAIMPEFGTMADFDAMLAQMHARGIRLMMDLVVNHTSDEHPWFVQARSSRDNPYHDYYIWAEPAPDGREPNNWEAAFQGSVWEWNEATGEYYLHMFSRKQPDLNWENPKVRQEVHDLMRFWLEKGVDGFRMDVINMISKPWDAQGRLPDAPCVREGFLQPGFALTCNGPRLLEFLQEMRHQVLDHFNTLTVGEAPMATVLQGQQITHPEHGALNMLFQFEHMDVDSVPGDAMGKWAWSAPDLPLLKQTLTRWQESLYGQGWNSLYWGNHDQPRPVSRFATDEPAHRVVAAKMLACCLHGMQGTPYIYQGEELGLSNVAFATIDSYRDIETLEFYRVATQERGWAPERALAAVHRKSRDNARVPMPWGTGPQAGFTSGTPWIQAHPDAATLNAAAALADPDSVFYHYQKLVRLRRERPLWVHGRYRLLLPDHPQLYVYERLWQQQAGLVLCNFSAQEVAVVLPAPWAGCEVEVVAANYPGSAHCVLQGLRLRPYEALWCESRSAATRWPSAGA